MIPVPPSDVDSLPPAEWHGGVPEHGLEARGVCQGVQTLSPSLTLRATKSTARSVMLWLALWSLLLIPAWIGFVPTADDLGAYHLPLRAYYQSGLQTGENWTWCPWIFGGYHLHGEGQIGGDHPLHQMLYRALPLHWAFGLECWWAYPATFFGMWWWLRQLRFSTAASQVAALAFSLCGFMTLRVVHTNAVQVIAHLPWLLGCLTWLEHRVRRSTSLRSLLPPIVCSALLTGSQLLLGYPQYVVFTLIAESLWVASLFLQLQQRANSKETAWIFATAWVVAKAIGLLLGAAQVLPTLEYLSLSERVNWTSEQMFEGSWQLLNLTQLVAPYLSKTRVFGQNTHELTIFMGLMPVCLTVLGLVNHPRRSQRVVKSFAIALCTVGLLLALGEDSPLAAVLPYMPVWNRFRFPCRSTLLLCLGIALLAALGYQRMFALAKQAMLQNHNDGTITSFSLTERSWLHGLFMISVLAAIYAVIAWSEHLNPWPCWLVGPVGIVLTWLVFYKMSIALSVRQLLPLVVGVELLLYAGTHANWQHQISISENIVQNENLSVDPSELGLGRQNIAAPDSLQGNFNIAPHLHGSKQQQLGHCLAPFAQINGYAGVQPRRQLRYDLDHPNALAAAGVTQCYTLSDRSQIPSTSPLITPALARGSLITKTEPAIQPARRIEQIDLQHVALVAEYLGLSPSNPSDRLQLELVQDRPGHLSFATATNCDALLVTTESYHPGWHARVDGTEVPVLRVNGDFLGVRVEAAAQRVELYFSDNWHAVGRWISLGSLGLLGLVLCLTRWRVARASCS